MGTTNYRISFYVSESEYNELKERADTMTIERGIKTSIHEIAKSYVLKTIRD